MVWMADSQRAASLADRHELPVRLHLNLTEPFTDPSVPVAVRQRQAKVARYFGRWRVAYWVYNPWRQSIVEECIEDQLQAFEQLYGRAPREIDGHNHVHTCPNVMLAQSLRNISAMRATFTFLRGEKGWAKRSVRILTNRVLRRRFESTQQFISLLSVNSRVDVGELTGKLVEARKTSLEVMTHPGVRAEYEFLMSEEWLHAMAGMPLGTFTDLQ
jgi:chitin disaccharide deacetylase